MGKERPDGWEQPLWKESVFLDNIDEFLLKIQFPYVWKTSLLLLPEWPSGPSEKKFIASGGNLQH